MSILNTHNLSIGYRKNKSCTTIISGLDLELKQGVLAALVGANGIGKSTLLRTLVGNQQPIAGIVNINNQNLSTISKKELSHLLSIVNTDRTQAGGLTVRELVALGRQPYTGFLGILDKNDRNIVSESMESAGIAHKAKHFLAELSDGERQKAMIAKALAQQTPIIILDEPTAFLDVESRLETMLLLHNLAHKQNKAILLSSHDLSQSLMLADELWVINHKREMFCGNTEDIALSGILNNIFTSPNITFDPIEGDFRIKRSTNQSVNLICNDDTLRKWITNALNRNNIDIDEKNTAPITIKALSSTEINILCNKNNVQAKSIAETISFLTELIRLP